MNTDQVFKIKIKNSSDFKFDAAGVDVFDDMVVRSVPFYLEIQRMITEIANDYAHPGSTVYDLGCSTGTTLLSLDTVIDPTIRFVGMDESTRMLESCQKNFLAHGVERPFQLMEADLNKQVDLRDASVVVLCLTLQFVRPINRPALLKEIFKQLNSGGCIILVEKVLGESPDFNRHFIQYYYGFKRRNSYEEMEIAQKREALENVLVPYTLSEDIQLLKNAGFHSCETFFKWHNFAGVVALK